MSSVHQQDHMYPFSWYTFIITMKTLLYVAIKPAALDEELLAQASA